MSKKNVAILNRKAAEAIDSGDAMRFSQAANNVANSLVALKAAKLDERKI